MAGVCTPLRDVRIEATLRERQSPDWRCLAQLGNRDLDRGGCSDVPTCSKLSPFLSHSCALFCTFSHSPKTQLHSFQSIPHSLPKNTGITSIKPKAFFSFWPVPLQ